MNWLRYKKKQQQQATAASPATALPQNEFWPAPSSGKGEGEDPEQIWWCGRQTHVDSNTHKDSGDFHHLSTFAPIHVAKIAAAHDHIIVLDDEGHVYGYGSSLQLGLGDDSTPFDSALRITRTAKAANDLLHTRFIDVAANLSHSVLVSQEGEVYTFGSGGSQLGQSEGGARPGLVSGFGPTQTWQAVRAEAATSDTGILTANQDLILFGGSWPTSSSGDRAKVSIPYDKYGKVVSFCVTDHGPAYVVTADGKLWSASKDLVLTEQPEFEKRAVTKVSTRGAHVLVLTGLPDWNRETHRMYSREFKKIVRAVLMLNASNPSTKQPYHLDSVFATLPTEIIMIIIQLLGHLYAGGTREVYSIIRDSPEKVVFPEPIVDVAAGYDHSIALSTTGVVYMWGDNAYGQAGEINHAAGDKSLKRQAPSLKALGKPVQRIYAGSYYSIALV